MQPERLVTPLLASPNSVAIIINFQLCFASILSRLGIADASIALPSLLPCLGELSEGLRGQFSIFNFQFSIFKNYEVYTKAIE